MQGGFHPAWEMPAHPWQGTMLRNWEHSLGTGMKSVRTWTPVPSWRSVLTPVSRRWQWYRSEKPVACVQGTVPTGAPGSRLLPPPQPHCGNVAYFLGGGLQRRGLRVGHATGSCCPRPRPPLSLPCPSGGIGWPSPQCPFSPPFKDQCSLEAPWAG